MDFEILPQFIIVLSVAGILFIMGRNYSKVKEASVAEVLFMETSAEAAKEKEKFTYLYKRLIRRINKQNYQKSVAKFWMWIEKLVRKIRISFLRMDTQTVTVLEKLRKKNNVSLEKLKATEKTFRKNIENENFSKFWSAKKQELRANSASKRRGVVVTDEPKTGSDVAEADYAIESESECELRTFEVASEAEIVGGENPGSGMMTEEVSAENETGAEPLRDEAPAEVEPIMSETEAYQAPEAAGIETEQEEETKEETEEEKKVRTQKEQDCIEILMKNPADIKAYWKLGLIYSKRRNYDDALACFRQIVKIDPTYTKAKQKAIELMEKSKKKDKQ